MSDMLIGGLQPFGLCDYPGHVAATVFVRGCNFRCPYCHNGHLLLAGRHGVSSAPHEEIWGFLERRRSRLHGVVISGGEPTIHDGLRTFIEHVRSLGFLVKLDTNGSRPRVIRALLDAHLLDYVAMDVKAPLRDDAYRRLAGVAVWMTDIKESIRLIADSGIRHEFRTTSVPSLLDDDDLCDVRSSLPGGSPHTVQQFRPEHALDPRLRRQTLPRSAASVRPDMTT